MTGRRLALPLFLGLCLLAYGAAASLQVTSGVVQAGSDATLTCDISGVTVSYQVGFYGSPPAFRISQLTVGGIDEDCLGHGYRIAVVLTDAGGSMLGGFVTPVGQSPTVTSSIGDPPVQDVHGVHVAIWKGGGGP